MQQLRSFIRGGFAGAVLAVALAYALAIQALVASVGFGMAATTSGGADGLVLCSFESGARSDAKSGAIPETQKNLPAPRPQCPFCFVAAHCGGGQAALDTIAAIPAYAGTRIAGTVASYFADRPVVFDFRHRLSEPRAPPRFSV